MNIYCTKCGSERVEDVILNLPEPEKESIDEFIEDVGKMRLVTTEMKYYNHRITCLDCGYSREYTA